jgi:hypothetical protein
MPAHVNLDPGCGHIRSWSTLEMPSSWRSNGNLDKKRLLTVSLIGMPKDLNSNPLEAPKHSSGCSKMRADACGFPLILWGTGWFAFSIVSVYFELVLVDSGE